MAIDMALRRFFTRGTMGPPPQPTSEKDGTERTTRFANFGFSRILPNRPSTSNLSSSSKLSHSATPPSTQSDAPTPTTDTSGAPSIEKPVPSSVTFEELLDVLSQPQDASTQLAFILATTDRLPSIHPPPRADVLATALLQPCSEGASTEVRNAGFNLLNVYLGLQSITSITSIDRSTFWHIVKGAGPAGSIVEWRSRAAVLTSLSSRAQRADGMDGLVSCLLAWLRHGAIWRLASDIPDTSRARASPTSEEADECIRWCIEQLIDVIRRESQSLLPAEVLSVVDTFDDILREVLIRILDERNVVTSPTRQKANSLDGIPQPLGSPSGHRHRKRHVTSQPNFNSTDHNESPHPDNRVVGDSITSSFLSSFSSLYLAMMRELLHFSLLPSTALSKLITTLALLMAYHSQPLPAVNVHTPTFRTSPEDQGKSSLSSAEAEVWESVRSLLASAGYATSTTRILRKLLLGLPLSSAPLVTLLPSSDPVSTFTQARLRALSAEGACRSMRLALRLAAEGRLARHWLSNQSDSYSHSGVPTFFDAGDLTNSSKGKGSTVDDILLRAWGKEGEGGAWEVDRVLGVLPDSVQVWVDARLGSEEDVVYPDQVLAETLGIVGDIVDEAVVTTDLGASGWASNNINLGVSEGRLVGEVMEKAFQYARRCRSVCLR